MRRLLALAALALAALPPRAHGTVADDLCPPTTDPCVLSAAATVDSDSTLDFGTRTLRLAPGAVVTWSTNLTVKAATCDFQQGSTVREGPSPQGSGFLELQCGSTTLAGKLTTIGAGVLITGDGPHAFSGQLVAKGDQVGVIAIDSYGSPGNITVSGKILAKSKIGTPPGEFRLNSNFGNIQVTETAKIKLQGAVADPFTEFFSAIAGTGSLTIGGTIDATAKTGAYAFNLEANGDVTIDAKAKVKAKAKETGAEIAINSQGGAVTVAGKVLAPAKQVTNHGARLRVCASGDVLIRPKAVLDSSSGSDGSIVVGAGGHVSVGLSSSGAKLLSKDAGDIEICGGAGAFVSHASKVVPDPEAVGTGVCLSPTSQVVFLLDCSQ